MIETSPNLFDILKEDKKFHILRNQLIPITYSISTSQQYWTLHNILKEPWWLKTQINTLPATSRVSDKGEFRIE